MKIIIDASNISPEFLVWLKKANDGHFYIDPYLFGFRSSKRGLLWRNLWA